MVGAKGLKQAPEPVAYMKPNHGHHHHIEGDITGVGKGGGDNLVNGGAGLVHKVEIEEVNDHKQENQNTGVGHGHRTDGAAAGPFGALVPGRPGGKVPVDQDQPCEDMGCRQQ